MLRWLSEGDHLDRYAETVSTAVHALSLGGAGAGASVPSSARVRIEPGARLWAVRRTGDACRWHLSPGFLAANGDRCRRAVG